MSIITKIKSCVKKYILSPKILYDKNIYGVKKSATSIQNFNGVHLRVISKEPIVSYMHKSCEDKKWSVYEKLLASIINNTSDLIHVDIGTNYGLDLIYTARQILKSKPHTHIIGFDPGIARYFVPENLRLNDLEKNVIFLPFALSDKIGIAPIYSEPDQSANNRIVNPLGDQTKIIDQVPTITLDAYVSTLNFSKDSTFLIKIDTQGAEPEVIKGAWHTITNYNSVIITEFTPDCIDTRMPSKVFLENLDTVFEIYDLGAERNSMTPVDSNFEMFAKDVFSRSTGRWTDLLLLPRHSPTLTQSIKKALDII